MLTCVCGDVRARVGGCDQVLKRGMSQLFDVRKLLEKAANPKWEITSAHRAR
eukprot:COSAG01_NODE_68963_length_262_cov_2.018405_1_plen_51_part_01